MTKIIEFKYIQFVFMHIEFLLTLGGDITAHIYPCSFSIRINICNNFFQIRIGKANKRYRYKEKTE